MFNQAIWKLWLFLKRDFNNVNELQHSTTEAFVKNIIIFFFVIAPFIMQWNKHVMLIYDTI